MKVKNMDKKLQLRMLDLMCRIRAFEEKAEELYTLGKIHGTMHLSIGMEASAVGSVCALKPDDMILSTHRGHGHCIAKGADLKVMMAEFMGKENGYCHGRGGSMHIADVKGGNLGANGVVSGGIPIAVGVGMGLKRENRQRIVMCFFGDGAANEGAFHESLNMAAIYRLPVVFICENNQYAMSLPFRKAFNVETISERAAGYGMPGETVDGNDVRAVHAAAGKAVELARSGNGPFLVETVTYRWSGHSKSDASRYRTREEIAAWKEKCPIIRFKARLLEDGIQKSEIEAIQAGADAAIREAVAFAEASPEPDLAEIERGVYA
jgi:TPP-dependent pyruvate/acetoin dehydrogenase alpha subunit